MKTAVIRQIPSEWEINRFSALDHSITYLVPNSHKPLNSEKIDIEYGEFTGGLSIERLPDWTSHTTTKLKNEQLLKEYDIVNTLETYTHLSKQVSKLASKYNYTHVCDVFETIPFHPWVLLFFRNALAVYNNTEQYCPKTKLAKQFLIEHNVDESKIDMIHPSVNTTVFHPIDNNNNNIGSKPPIKILFVGRLVRDKGIEYLLEAFSDISKNYDGVELHIAGNGKLKSKLEKYNNCNIIFHGWVERHKLPELYRNSDIFCVPSQDKTIFGKTVSNEQFGAVFAEAIASGIPVVSTNCGAIPEVLGDGNYEIAQKSKQELVVALKRLIENDVERHMIGKSNRNRAEKYFDLNVESEKIEKLYENIINI